MPSPFFSRIPDPGKGKHPSEYRFPRSRLKKRGMREAFRSKKDIPRRPFGKKSKKNGALVSSKNSPRPLFFLTGAV
jgi:hypothetical protein